MMTQAVRVDSESGVSQAPSPGHGFFFRKGGGGVVTAHRTWALYWRCCDCSPMLLLLLLLCCVLCSSDFIVKSFCAICAYCDAEIHDQSLVSYPPTLLSICWV